MVVVVVVLVAVRRWSEVRMRIGIAGGSGGGSSSGISGSA